MLPTPRILGLSKRQQPKPLHTTIGGRARSERLAAAERRLRSREDGKIIEDSAPQARSRPEREEPAVDAPPMSSSSDESSECDSVKEGRTREDSAREGHRASKGSRSIMTSAGFPARSVDAEGGEEPGRRSQMDRPPKNSRAKFGSGKDNSSSDTSSPGADMIKTTFGATKAARLERESVSSRATRDPNAGKRRRSALADDDEYQGSNRRQKKTSISNVGEDFMQNVQKRTRSATYASKPRAKQQRKLSPPGKPTQRAEPKPKKGFIRPTRLPSEDESPIRVFKKPHHIGVQDLPWSKESSPEMAFLVPTRLLDQEPPPSSASDLGLRDQASPSSRLRGGSVRSLSPMSDLDSLLEDGPMCPMCHEAVAQDLLDQFKQKHPRMTITQQRRFCDLHIEASTRKTWRERGYPDINWDAMERRISKHRGFLRNILRGAQSYYTNVFNQKVKAGVDKTTIKSEKSLTPGYYGPRGLRIMTESIMEYFLQMLLERSLEDRLIAARGRVAYVQSVLVPEVAVKLIMEDMDVDEVGARTILTDSAPLGDVLNEETEDINQSGASASEAESI